MDTPLEFEPVIQLLEPQVRIDWWVLVHGEVEAEKILQLPRHMREELYPHGMNFGPASEEVVQFVECLAKEMSLGDAWNNASGSRDKSESLLAVRMRELELLFIDNPKFLDELRRITLSPAMSFLEASFRTLISARGYPLFRQTQNVGCWLSTSQYLSDEAFLRESEPFVEPMNRVLTELHLPLLEKGRSKENAEGIVNG